MAVWIQNPSKCEVRAVSRLIHEKGETAAEIHRQFLSVYGETWQNVIVNMKRKKVIFKMKQGMEGHPLSLIKSSKNL
jgi:hypothetical protein